MTKVSILLTDAQIKAGLIARFDPSSPIAVFPLNYKDSKLPPAFIPPENIIFIAFFPDDGPENKKETESKASQTCTLHLLTNRVFTVHCDPEEVKNPVGFFGYPVDSKGLYEKYWFYHHAILVYEDQEPIGKKLVKQGIIDQSTLDESLKKQQELRNERLGNILKTRSVIDEDALKKALKEQEIQHKGKNKLRLGDVLIEAGLATPKDIENALNIQKRQKNKRLGEILVEQGVVTEEDLMRVLALKFNLSFIDLDDFEIDRDAMEHMPNNLCLKYNLLPVKTDDNTITIAIADPLAFESIDMLRFFTQKEVRQVLVTPSQMKKYLEPLTRELDEESSDATFNQLVDLLKEIEPETEEETEEETDDSFYTPSDRDPGVVKVINYMILEAARLGASDIHIEPAGKREDVKVRIRIDGKCHTMWRLPAAVRRQLVSRIKIMSNLDISEKRKPQDGKIKLKAGTVKIELRVATVPVVGGDEDVVLRILAGGKPIPMEKLGLSDWNYKKLSAVIEKPYGIVLVVGPTGSGKTTTLHSILARLNTDERKIWTAEDPVEITQPGLRQVQMNPKAGLVFATALRAFLRADPDIIMVGEMRDLETVQIALQASLTGHLVFSTLHTNSAPETITRLLDMGVDPFTFSDALLGVLSQRLVRTLCTACKQEYEASRDEIDFLTLQLGTEEVKSHMRDGKLYLYRSTGCKKCRHTGYKGRMGIHEFVNVDDEIRKAIQQKLSVHHIWELAQKAGSKTLLQDGLSKVLQGHTDIREVNAVTGGSLD